MNRRELAKIVAATAAGSVAGKVCGHEERERLADWLAQHVEFELRPGTGVLDTIDISDEVTQRVIAMDRLQQAIELGDRTAAELGGLYWNLIRAGALGRWQAIILSGTPFVVAGSADDPDPLTAVQKAREAALEWMAEHGNCTVFGTLDGVPIHADDSLNPAGPKPGLPDTTWKRLKIRGKCREGPGNQDDDGEWIGPDPNTRTTQEVDDEPA